MRLYTFTFPSLLAVALLLSGCSEHVEPPEDDCLRPDYRDKVAFSLSVDDSFFHHKDVESYPEETRAVDYPIRYVVSVYDPSTLQAYSVRSDDSEEEPVYPKPVASIISDSPEFSLSLSPGKYRVIAWADYEPTERSDNHYFHVDDFTDMLLVDKFGYKGDDDYKNGFSVARDITVSYRTPTVEMTLSTMMAQYRLTASDSPDFAVGRIAVSYPEGVPASMNLLTDKICHHWSGILYHASEGDLITADNILAETEELTLTVKVEVYDQSGVLRARRNAIQIPLIRGGITNVKAQLFTVKEGEKEPDNSSGGMGINDKYDDTIFIVL